MDRDTIPTEEEQFEAYKSVAETMKGKPVIIRTLDIGGDKEIPYLGLEKEDNPFLGYRAIRFCLQRTDIYNTQLRALVRASAFGRIKIMVPLVTCVDELRSVKAMVADIMKELDAEGIAYNKNLEIGIMMETPAACMMADVLAKGSLLQYRNKRPDRLHNGSRPWKLKGSIPLFSLQSGSASRNQAYHRVR